MRYFEQRMSFEDEEALRRNGLKRSQQIAVWSSSLMPQLVLGTARIATLPRRAAQCLAEHWPVRLVPFPWEQEPARSYAYWHSSRDDDPVLTRFLTCVRDEIAQMT